MALFESGMKKALREAVMSVAREAAKTIKRRAVENLSGKVLKSRTGALRNSVSSRAEQDGRGARIVVGNSIHYGRFWEFGTKSYLRKLKALRAKVAAGPGGTRTIKLIRKQKRVPARAARPWLGPAVAATLPEIRREAENKVAANLQSAISKAKIKIAI